MPTIKNFESPELHTIAHSENPAAEIRVPSGWKVIGGGLRVDYKDDNIIHRSSPILSSSNVPIGWGANAVAKNKMGRIQVYAVALYDPWNHWVVRCFKKTEKWTAGIDLPRGYVLGGGGFSSSRNVYVVQNQPTTSGWSVKLHPSNKSQDITVSAIGMFSRYGKQYARDVRRQTVIGTYPQFSKVKSCLRAEDGWRYISVGFHGEDNVVMEDMYIDVDGSEICLSSWPEPRTDKANFHIFGIRVRLKETLGAIPGTIRRFESPITPGESATLYLPRGRFNSQTPWRVLSGGGYLKQNNTNAYFLASSYPVSRPFRGLLKKYYIDYGWTVKFVNPADIIVGPVQVQVYIIAVYDKQNSLFIQHVANRATGHNPRAVATLPSSLVMVGGGARAGVTGPRSMLSSNRPIGSNQWEARSSTIQPHGVEHVEAFAIGIRKYHGWNARSVRLISKTVQDNRNNFECIRPSINHSFVSVGSSVTRKGFGVSPLNPGHFLQGLFISSTGNQICASSSDTNLADPRGFTIYGLEVLTRSAQRQFRFPSAVDNNVYYQRIPWM